MDRESSEDQRKRQDAEKDEARRARQERLGHVEQKKSKGKKKDEKKEENDLEAAKE